MIFPICMTFALLGILGILAPNVVLLKKEVR